ncbi:uncharacterized protein N7483_007861 [Penicillium malachiteum]|uniref:uncharacterized protein n=1 Tax=Penicillium malachiteum TaxID=1324776 RepID=UPI002547C42C|nr:uncharacterized protein N7483_007861 [Penicillium malachiteum]KAJ5726504.1 hypothetical protein N7483_007861 [Penicillium malachiteum]
MLGIIRKKCTLLDDMMIDDVKAQFEDKDDQVRIAAIQTFQNWVTYTQGRHLLQDLDVQAKFGRSESIRSAAFRAMGKQRHLGPKWIEFLDVQLQNTLNEGINPSEADQAQRQKARTGKSNIAKEIIQALGQQQGLRPDNLQLLLAQIQNRDSSVRHTAIDAVKLHCPNNCLIGELTLWLENKELSTQKAVIGNSSTKIRSSGKAFISGLQKWLTLEDEILDAVMECLGDEDSTIRRTAINILGGQLAFKDKYADVFKSQVQHDKDISCQNTALEFLLDWLSFEDLGFDMISEWIRDKNIQYTVLGHLSRRPQLRPDPSLKFVKLLISLYLKDNVSENEKKNWGEKELASRILANFHDAHPDIQDKCLETIMHGVRVWSPVCETHGSLRIAKVAWSRVLLLQESSESTYEP